MRYSAVFPTTEIGSDPGAIRAWAQAAEDLGYTRIVAYDHVVGAVHAGREPALAGPYDEGDAFHEPLVLFGYLAGLTRTIELATGILILPQRQTALVAKQAAEVDLLSGGRLVLGLGTGWNFVEYESLGVPFARRGKRLDEQVDLLRRLWRDPLVDVTGRFHRIDRAGLLPRPARDIPIWFGGFSDVAFRRAARVGDGFFFAGPLAFTLPQWQRLRTHLGECGRDPSRFPAEAHIEHSAGPDAWRRDVAAWENAGGSSVALVAMDTAASFRGAKPVGYAGPDSFIAALREFKVEVGF